MARAEKNTIVTNHPDGTQTTEVVDWTEAELAAHAAADAIAYKNAREAGYKELKEQLDLLYHDMTADKGDKTGEWYKHIKAVKDANPKP